MPRHAEIPRVTRDSGETLRDPIASDDCSRRIEVRALGLPQRYIKGRLTFPLIFVGRAGLLALHERRRIEPALLPPSVSA